MRTRMQQLATGILLAVFISPSSSLAEMLLSAQISYSSGSGAAHEGYEKGHVGFGAEIAERINPYLSLGLFGEMGSLTASSGSGGKLYFLGSVLRAGFGDSFPLFFDFRAGATKVGGGAGASDFDFGYGLGGGYQFSLGNILAGPRIGYRTLNHTVVSTTTQRQVLDIGLFMTYRIGGGTGGYGR